MIVHGWRYSVKRLDCPTNDLLHVLLILSHYNTFWGGFMPEILFCCNFILLDQRQGDRKGAHRHSLPPSPLLYQKTACPPHHRATARALPSTLHRPRPYYT